jgi:hypothetical protein
MVGIHTKRKKEIVKLFEKTNMKCARKLGTYSPEAQDIIIKLVEFTPNPKKTILENTADALEIAEAREKLTERDRAAVVSSMLGVITSIASDEILRKTKNKIKQARELPSAQKAGSLEKIDRAVTDEVKCMLKIIVPMLGERDVSVLSHATVVQIKEKLKKEIKWAKKEARRERQPPKTEAWVPTAAEVAKAREMTYEKRMADLAKTRAIDAKITDEIQKILSDESMRRHLIVARDREGLPKMPLQEFVTRPEAWRTRNLSLLNYLARIQKLMQEKAELKRS